MQRLLPLLCLLLVACGGAAATSMPAPTILPRAPTPATTATVAALTTLVPPGGPQTVKTGNWSVVVRGLEVRGASLQTGDKSAKEAVGVWVVLVADATNIGPRAFGLNPSDFGLVNGAGQEFGKLSGLDSGYSTYRGGFAWSKDVPPGTTVTFYLPFDATKGATGLAVVFNQETKPRVVVGDLR